MFLQPCQLDPADPLQDFQKLQKRIVDWVTSSRFLRAYIQDEFLSGLHKLVICPHTHDDKMVSDTAASWECGETKVEISPGGAQQQLQRISKWMEEFDDVLEDIDHLAALQLDPSERPDKVIFLDVDGVLHPLNDRGLPAEVKYDELIERGNYISGSADVAPVLEGEFLLDCMKQLRTLVETTGAALVCSSTWRETPDELAAVNQQLTSNGINACVSKTPSFTSSLRSKRACEVLAWVDANAPAAFVVLDDQDLIQYAADGCTAAQLLQPHFIRVTADKGLQEQDVSAAAAVLDCYS